MVLTIARMASIKLPFSHRLQACVTAPWKPFLDVAIVSANLQVYVNQSDRGELVLGSKSIRAPAHVKQESAYGV